MARIKYYDAESGEWKYADQAYTSNSSQNVSVANPSTFKTQTIGELFDHPLAYTGWCSGSLHYDEKLGKYVDLLYCAPKHENPDYTANYIVYIDPKTYEATEPALCKYYDTDGSTELAITMAGRPAFVILQDGSYMMLLEVESAIHRFISNDNGLSWVKGEAVSGYSGSSECYALVRLSNGRILANAISRIINYSDDDGITWTSVTPTTAGGSYEAEYFFLEVKPGIVLGICRMTVEGNGRTASGECEHAVITVSEDYGTTWRDLKISDTIDNMNASTCTGYVHDGMVEIFAASRWYNNGDYAVTDYVNTGKSGAITHYVATVENALNDKFTKLGVVVYAKTTGNAVTLAAQDFHTPCIAVNGDDMLMVYFDRVAPYNEPNKVNHHYIRGSLTGIDYGVRDDLKSTIFPYSSAQVDKLMRKQYNELIVKINEAILSGEVIPPGESEDGTVSSYVLDGIVVNFNFTDESKVDANAKTVTDTINGVVATCADETFPQARDNSLGLASFQIPALSEYFNDTVNFTMTIEASIYRYDDDTWEKGQWFKNNTAYQDAQNTIFYREDSSAWGVCYLDSNSTLSRKTIYAADMGLKWPNYPIPNSEAFTHFAITLSSNGTMIVYRNGEQIYTFTPESFGAWHSKLIEATTKLNDCWKSYRVYSRALTAEEVASNYQYELVTIV